MTAPSPASLLKLWSVTPDGTIVTTQGCYLRAFKLGGLDSEHFPGEVLVQAAQQIYEDSKRDLAEENLLQFVLEGHSDYSDVFSRFEAIPQPKDPVLAHQRARRLAFLKNSNLRRFTTTVATGSMQGLSRKDFAAFGQDEHARRREAVEGHGRALSAIARRAGVPLVPLTRGEVLGHYFSALSPGSGCGFQEEHGVTSVNGAQRFRPTLGPKSIREQLFTLPVTWDDHGVRIGRRWHKVLTLKGLPDRTRFTLMEVFLQLRFDFRLSVNVFVPNQEVASHAFRTSRRIAHADAHRSEHVADSERIGRAMEANVLSDLLADSKQRLLLVGMQLSLWGDSETEVENRAVEVQEYLKRYGLLFVEETSRHDRELPKTLLGMGTTFDRWKMVTSNNAVDLMPLFGACHGDRDPVLLVTTARGELFSYNPVESNRDNWNAAVFGASGSGKSVAMNMLITSAMLSNITRGRLLVVDFAGETKSSYLMVAKLFGGTFIPILSRDADVAINPFPPPRLAIDGAGKLRSETLNFLLVLTDLLVSNTGVDMEAQLYRTVMQRALSDVYQGRTEDHETPIYSDLLKVLRGYRDVAGADSARVETLVRLLQGFIDSPDARLFNRPSTVTAESDFLIFDLFGIDTLPARLREALTFLVCQYVRGLAFDAKDDGIKYVVLDEVAQLLRRPEMVALVHELYSTARKHRTSIWTVTQKYSDYVQSAVAGTIKLNSTTHMFLSHARAAEARRQIAEDFDLNARERVLFDRLITRKGEYSEALLRTEVFDEVLKEKRSIAAKLRIQLSPFDYQLSTSDAADRAVQRKALQANPDRPVVEVLDWLAHHAPRLDPSAAVQEQEEQRA